MKASLLSLNMLFISLSFAQNPPSLPSPIGPPPSPTDVNDNSPSNRWEVWVGLLFAFFGLACISLGFVYIYKIHTNKTLQPKTLQPKTLQLKTLQPKTSHTVHAHHRSKRDVARGV